MYNAKWLNFAPTGDGGSFGREDMGNFCEIDDVLFVVPLFESATNEILESDLEIQMHHILKNARVGEVYEFREGSFTRETTTNWIEKIKGSLIADTGRPVMGHTDGSHLYEVETLNFTRKQRVDLLANAIVDRIIEDRKNGYPLLRKIATENMAKSKVPVYTINLPQYQVDTEPDHKAIGRIVDDEIKKHFLGQTVLIRGVGSMEHPDLSIDDLIALIVQLGSDRYDPQRVGDRYENIDGKKIDLFALRRKITPKSQVFWQLSWSFYRSPLKMRGYPVKVDILIIYDPAQLKAVVHQPTNHPHIKRDGFVFRDPDNASAAVKAIFKITSQPTT